MSNAIRAECPVELRLSAAHGKSAQARCPIPIFIYGVVYLEFSSPSRNRSTLCAVFDLDTGVCVNRVAPYIGPPYS